MPKKNVSSFVWRMAFSLVYTAVTLPFLVNFFRSIANPAIEETLMSIIPLVQIHRLMLPLFLMSLEFAAVALACALWKKAQSTNKVFILLLFLGCQLFPVVSLYYDVRSKDFEMERKVHESNKKELVTSLSNRIKGLDGQISVLSKNLMDMKKGRYDTNKGINQLLLRKELPLNLITDMKAEIRERKMLREKDEERGAELFNEKKAIESDRLRLEDELQAAQSKKMRYGTQLEYIVMEAISYKSAFAGFIAFLFPLTILSVAFVLTKGSENNYAVTSFEFQDYLKYGSSLPRDMHLTYTKMLTPSVSAYMTALQASKSLANEGLVLHLQNEMCRQLIDESGTLKEAVLQSKLDENSKNYLINEIDGAISKNLFYKEEHRNERQ